MKKLNRMQINSDRVMSNSELLKLKGGDDGWCCTCNINGIHMAAANAWDCGIYCAELGSASTYLPCGML